MNDLSLYTEPIPIKYVKSKYSFNDPNNNDANYGHKYTKYVIWEKFKSLGHYDIFVVFFIQNLYINIIKFRI